MSDNKAQALKAAMRQMNKQFGEGIVMRLGERASQKIAAISTGSIGLDIALGMGGLPRGRIVEIYGEEASGKTTLALHVIAEAQKGGGTAAFIDAEHAFDSTYAAQLGVDTDSLLISQPDSGEQALEIADTLINTGALDIIVIDSVAALVPRAEIDGEIGDQHVGLQARLMSQALRKLAGNLQRSDTLIIFINQMRVKIGVMYGNPNTTTGGKALRFYASVRLEIFRRNPPIKEGDKAVGAMIRVKVAKNKVAPPFREAEFQLTFGVGIDSAGEILDVGVQRDLVDKSGAWYGYKGERIGQGRVQARQYLLEHPEVMEEIRAQIHAPVEIVEAEAPEKQ